MLRYLVLICLVFVGVSCVSSDEVLPKNTGGSSFYAKLMTIDHILANNLDHFDLNDPCRLTSWRVFFEQYCQLKIDSHDVVFYLGNILLCEEYRHVQHEPSTYSSEISWMRLDKGYKSINEKERVQLLGKNQFDLLDGLDQLSFLSIEVDYNFLGMNEFEQVLVADYLRYLIFINDWNTSCPGISIYFLNQLAMRDAQCEIFLEVSEVIDQYEIIEKMCKEYGLELDVKRSSTFSHLHSLLDPVESVRRLDSIYNNISNHKIDDQKYFLRQYLEVLVFQFNQDLNRISTVQKRLKELYSDDEDLSFWINLAGVEIALNNFTLAEYYLKRIDSRDTEKLSFIPLSYLKLYKGQLALYNFYKNNRIAELYLALNNYQDFYNGISSKVGKSNTLHYADWHKESLLYLVNIYLELYQATGEEKWLDEANASFSKCKYIITQTQLLQGERMHQWPVEVQRQLDDINVQLDQLEGMDKILSPLNEERYKIYKKHVVYKKREEEVDTINYLAAEIEEEGFHLSDSTLQIVEYLTDASYNFVRVFNADTQYIERIEFSDEMNIKLNHTIRAIQENKEILYSKELYDSIVSPYLSPDYPKVVFIPDGQLSSLPFEALVTELDTNGVPTYLIDDYEVSYTYHLSALKEEEETYPLDDIGMFSLTDNITMRDRRKKIMPELHGGWAEVQQCADLASNYDIVRYQGYEANEAALEDVLRRDIAHFATHAASNPDNRLDNYLYVRQDEKMVRYYGYNIPTLDIDAKLAILSACETGTGAYTRGEGVHSISRYLIGEGVPSVMKTLWKVNDNNSGLLLSQFYKSILDGNDLSSAINSAKHKVKEVPEYSHPYYWAGYVLDGNPYLRFDLENQ